MTLIGWFLKANALFVKEGMSNLTLREISFFPGNYTSFHDKQLLSGIYFAIPWEH